MGSTRKPRPRQLRRPPPKSRRKRRRKRKRKLKRKTFKWHPLWICNHSVLFFCFVVSDIGCAGDRSSFAQSIYANLPFIISKGRARVVIVFVLTYIVIT